MRTTDTAEFRLPITPTPKFAHRERRRMALPAGTPLLLGRSFAPASTRWAVAPLVAGLGTGPVRTVAGKAPLPSPAILVGGPQDHPEIGAVDALLRARLGSGAGCFDEEGYLLSVAPGGVRVVANSPAGVFYACRTLLQLAGSGRTLPLSQIADAPAYPVRGYSIMVRGPGNASDLERLIREFLPRHKANLLVLGIGYRFRYRSHPEIREQGGLTAAQCRRLARIGREHAIRVVPLVNCYGHQSSATGRPGALLRAYPEFNETPGKQEISPCGYNWCPSNPAVYRVVFDLLDEVVEAFETDTLHVGMDEVFEFGACPLCRGLTPAGSFARAVNTIHKHVVGRRGLKMMIWGDRLVDGFKTPYNQFNGSRVGTYPARRLIPRDVLLCDWHYHRHECYPSVDQFERAGLDYVICPWWKRDALVAFTRYADEHSRRHLKGILQTNWHGATRGLPVALRPRRPRAGYTGDHGERQEIEAAAANFIASMEWGWKGAQDETISMARAASGPPPARD